MPSRPRSRQRSAVWLALAALAFAWPTPVAVAQPLHAGVLGLDVAGTRYVEAASLAVVLGDVVTAAGEVLTWRGPKGVVTFFLGSPQALLQAPGSGGPDEWTLSAPVRRAAPEELAGLARPPPASQVAGWLLPLDAVQLLGVMAEADGTETTLRLPGGDRSAIAMPPARSDTPFGTSAAWEVVELSGTHALRLFVGDQLSLLLLDLDLAPLAVPEATAAVDAAVALAGSDQVLLLLVSALEEMAWDSTLVFEQDGRVLEVRHPYRLKVYQGSSEVVAPDAPAAAVVLLPVGFSLYRPLNVSWAAVEATITFRH